ncbi:fimb protein [Acidovorax sp. ACV01]|uniref:fimb protein n=1 Tax=Acidovorax sp. ACV01 TaxID=2769311 RepID=UPI00177BB4BE|nr:fimb protein [Acidovorax sp. ACV01]MBD9393012.1 fimb protein [Acidovorax sp. ACV01]
MKGAKAPFFIGLYFYMKLQNRWYFAVRWALRHAFVSLAVGLISAVLVFQWWYPMPYRQMLGVGNIFILVLIVDIVCGPLMTLVLASPSKSKREMVLDLSLIGIIQAIALIYGIHAVWIGRPAVLAFENDRLIVISANEIEHSDLMQAPEGLRVLPFSGVLKVTSRKPKDNAEFLRSIDLSLAGLSPAMRPARWEPIENQHHQMRTKAKPLAELIARRSNKSAELNIAASHAGYKVEALTYLPLTSSKTREWVALLNPSMDMVGYAPVDGFDE